MKFFEQGSGRRFLLGALIMAAVCVSASAEAASRRDALLEIVGNCLDPSVADYCSNCRSPRSGTACAAGKACWDTTEVWAETRAYVAIRDRNMCGCPDDFVHGLALPRASVTGVEDPRRPDGIWDFAWANATRRIGDEWAAALAVNPARRRSQDQLHVHIVRLRPDARGRFAKARTARVRNLDEVWTAAGKTAAAARLPDYGVLVARHPDGGFIVLVDRAGPVNKYTLRRCR